MKWTLSPFLPLSFARIGQPCWTRYCKGMVVERVNVSSGVVLRARAVVAVAICGSVIAACGGDDAAEVVTTTSEASVETTAAPAATTTTVEVTTTTAVPKLSPAERLLSWRTRAASTGRPVECQNSLPPRVSIWGRQQIRPKARSEHPRFITSMKKQPWGSQSPSFGYLGSNSTRRDANRAAGEFDETR